MLQSQSYNKFLEIWIYQFDETSTVHVITGWNYFKSTIQTLYVVPAFAGQFLKLQHIK